MQKRDYIKKLQHNGVTIPPVQIPAASKGVRETLIKIKIDMRLRQSRCPTMRIHEVQIEGLTGLG